MLLAYFNRDMAGPDAAELEDLSRRERQSLEC